METKINADHLADFRRLSSKRLNENGGVTKFNYALAKMLRRTDPCDKNFNTEVLNLKIEHATKDKDGNLVKSADGRGQMTFTPEAQKESNTAILDLSNEK